MTKDKIWRRIARRWRNHGESLGLEFPYLAGKEPVGERWRVWHRHTGEVVFVADERPAILNQYRARAKSEELNKPPPFNPAILDSTPLTTPGAPEAPMTPEEKALRLLFDNEWLKAKIMSDDIEPLAGGDEPTAEDWKKVVAGLGAVIRRATEERDEAYTEIDKLKNAIREAEASARRAILDRCCQLLVARQLGGDAEDIRSIIEREIQ